MKLFLLRHGIAVERGAPGYDIDGDRPLTPKGVRKIEKIAGKMLTGMKIDFDAIYSSPLLRARRTAEIVAKVFDMTPALEFLDSLAPEGTPDAVIEDLSRRLSSSGTSLDNILLVGHEPALSELGSFLLHGDVLHALPMMKGGLCGLSIPALAGGRCATLDFLLTPRLIQRLD
ncbi:MAG: phosphohistidine phosphatase SixA [Candidatus Hydrogenedentota bacterium]